MIHHRLQGVLLSQATFYFNTYANDSNATRGFIGAVTIMNMWVDILPATFPFVTEMSFSFKSVMCGSTLWVRSVDRFGDWNAITHGAPFHFPILGPVLISSHKVTGLSAPKF